MDFALTETQTDLRAAARRYLGDRYPASRIAELSDAAGHDGGAWPELERQGWLDADLGMVELALLAEEGGRALHPAPWWATAGQALPVYAAAGVGLPGPATLADGSDTCRASRECDGWLLRGRVASVVDARAAAEIVVAARTGTGVALLGVRPDAPGLSRVERAGIDPLREVSDLELVRTPARLLVGSPSAEPLLASAGRRAVALLACEAVGVADRALELAVEYAGTRVQFDRPIGSYQAVGHLLADGYAELELARSLAYRAACALQDQAEDAGQALACAVHAAGQAATRVCETAIQVCGGIGVTWEFPVHRWYRRALWLEAFHAGRPDPLAALAEVVLG
ncbi:acyl-CoA dehydrogenase family protein [Streptosporangium sp. CA-135522]|uniref:acyl-CoA dehydrogenase family protein n=1 Tax=Streptosporangium sp. CA-135522 TaxID=3240072 RepID=UPI003D8FD23F